MTTRTAAVVCRCALICLRAYPRLAAAAGWTLSGIAGSGNHVDVAGGEIHLPHGAQGRTSIDLLRGHV
jgi:hypothetical protein